MTFYERYLVAVRNFIQNYDYGLVIVVGASGVLLLCSFYLVVRCCCKEKKAMASENFKWPSSKSFLRRASPVNPPTMVVPKYEDPLRTDLLPEGDERHWILQLQPNGERDEVQQQMYLVFKDGIVFGVGYEPVRKLCKIKGKYKYNAASNQTVLAMDCFFSNERDHILLHGTGNGTALVGNCYIHEIDPFSATSGVPMVRKMFGDKFKGSFLLQMHASMGDHHIRQLLHTRRVHKFAKELFPDLSVPMPTSPLRHLPEAHGDRESSGDHNSRDDGYSLVDAASDTSRSRRRGSRTHHTSPPRSSGGSSRFFAKMFRRGKGSGGGGGVEWGGRREYSAGSSEDQLPGLEIQTGQPAWVKNAAGSRSASGAESPSASDRSGRHKRRRSSGSGRGRHGPYGPKANSKINKLNYLEVDAIPGRSGPAMV